MSEFNYPPVLRDMGFTQRFCLADIPQSSNMKIQLLTSADKTKKRLERRNVINVYGVRDVDEILENKILRISVCPTLEGNTVSTGRSLKVNGDKQLVMLVTNGKHINLILPGQEIFLQTNEATTYLDIIFFRTAHDEINISKATTIYENINGQSMYHIQNYFVMKRGVITYTCFTTSTVDNPPSTIDDDDDDGDYSPSNDSSGSISVDDDTCSSNTCDDDDDNEEEEDISDSENLSSVNDICEYYLLSLG